MFYLFLLLLSSFLSPASPSKLALIYRSTPTPQPLLQSTYLAWLDANLSPQTQQPLLIDLTHTSIPSALRLLNQTKSLLSLLDNPTLHQLAQLSTPDTTPFTLFTPLRVGQRKLLPPHFRIYSLQMSEAAVGVAIAHRASLVGTEALIPVLDSSIPNLDDYSGGDVPVLNPLLLPLSRLEGDILRKERNKTLGLLLLPGEKEGSEFVGKLWAESSGSHNLRWFSPSLIPLPPSLELFGLYSPVFVGAGEWDNPPRRRLLNRLNQFTGPSPIILTAVLAYDAARLAHLYAHTGLELDSSHLGMSGDIKFNAAGDRDEGVFFGVSAIPNTAHRGPSPLLQPSEWVLEDILHLGPSLQVQDHHVATSSLLTKEDIVGVGSGAGLNNCQNESLIVTTHDPFNQLNYAYAYTPPTLPPHLLIPNQYGFGLSFSCKEDKGHASLSLACTPQGKNLGGGVHCFRSALRRSRSSSSFKRDDSMFYPGSPPPDYYHMGGYPVDSSTPGYMTTRLDVPISEDPPSTAAPPPGTSKLPELRQILKAAKPFVGSCIGATTGCAICVLVLGRLPLGAVPAACTGPCFVGTFGSCGSLLGRVFAETTVICTELFRQGLLDTETFLADAHFGRHLLNHAPSVLKGYQRLATPLVGWMQGSGEVTRIVATVALPWSRHMKYLVGEADEWEWSGWLIHWMGWTLCAVVGVAEGAWGLARVFLLSTLFLLWWGKRKLSSSCNSIGGCCKWEEEIIDEEEEFNEGHSHKATQSSRFTQGSQSSSAEGRLLMSQWKRSLLMSCTPLPLRRDVFTVSKIEFPT